jgi:hypothetical protein
LRKAVLEARERVVQQKQRVGVELGGHAGGIV